MAIRFERNIISHVPTCCLVEDYQMLFSAKKNNDWESVGSVMECLAEVIRRYSEVPEGCSIEPTECSIIAMGQASGIVLNNNKDILCANGHPISNAGDSGICNKSCHHFGHCDADEGILLLEGNVRYVFDNNDESFLDKLDEYYAKES